MSQVTSIQLTRECRAVQIPAGTPVTLAAGTPVDVTQTLGGSFTVHVNGALYRIAGSDADALGLKSDGTKTDAPDKTLRATATLATVDETQVWAVLKSCYDPEIPVNIVDLGLVYDLHLEPGPTGGSRISVQMTLTAPGCGMGTVIAGDAREKLLTLDGVEDAEVTIVWDPPWHQSMITADGRRILGL